MTNATKEYTMDRRARRLAVAAALAVASLLIPASAQAGEYQQHFCLSGTGVSTHNAWARLGSPAPQAYCAAGSAFPYNGVYYNSSSLALNDSGQLRSDAPPGARYKSLLINLRVPYQAANRRTFIEANSAYVFNWHNGWGGSSTYNPDGNFFSVDLAESPYFAVGQACHGSDGGGCESGDFFFTGAMATLTDTTAPKVTPDIGQGLFEAGRTVFRGTVAVVADVTDSGHGPWHGRLVVNGVEQPQPASEDWGAACNYRLSNPCPSRFGWTRMVDTSAYGDGVRTVKVVGEDGMGQAAFAERSVTFDNTPPVMGEAPAVDGKTVSGDTARLEVKATDATSGVARLEAFVDAGPWQEIADGGQGTLQVEGAGPHVVKLRAVDVAGNVSLEQVVSFTLQIAPDNQKLVTVEDQPLPGAPGPGDVVKCDVGSPWTQGTEFAFRWLRDAAVIEGAVDQTYTVVPGDAGYELACRVVATNDAGETERTTAPVLVGSDRCFGQVGPTQRCGDFDGDGEENGTDPDDDNDGVNDGSDPAPFDPVIPGSGGGGGATPSGTSGSGSGARTDPAVAYIGPPTNGVNASNRARITVEGTRRRTVKFGRRIATVAHLRDEHGRPITGATVTVLERMNVPGAQWTPARAPLVSDSRGRLRWIIPAKFSRTIRYAYKANLANSEFQSTSDVVLTVFSKSTLKTSRRVARNGQSVAFLGRLRSRPVPRGGVLIDLQAKVGRRWQTFRTVRTKVSGRWKTAYRFRSTRGVQIYSFRARVRQDSAYPYAISTTRRAKVKVIG